MIKLIASDMDGTLLNDQMEVSDNNANAIKAAQDSGIEFLVATGRGIKEARPFFEYAHINSGFITLNGAEVFNTKQQVVDTHKIKPALVKKITDKFSNEDIYFELITNKGIFSNSYDKRLSSVADLMILLNPGLTMAEAMKISEEKLKLMTTNYINSYDEILGNNDYDILKVIAFDSRGRDYLKDLIAKDNEDGNLVVTSSSVNNIEINDKMAQKGLALLDYAKHQGYKPEEIMAIGDNLNDYSMIKMAGVGVAMKNAIPEIKEIANMQTDTNVNDGVAKAIKKAINL
ncbi:Cof-type HAD-IIB family hydrolase [Companilactobacillus sp. DQM5]|uniref:Cof-type HAD-IIB family hydrolase n=1 Tax=Companilactobacillus sp. DQM5 TaxID=3463359 RepID=UPI004059F5D3